jgi:phosphoglycolate phosphatase
MRYRAILFDLDGTLLDTLEDLADATNAAMERFGWPVHELEAYRYFVGNGMRMLVRRAMPATAASDEQAVDRACEVFREIYATNWHAKTHPYDGVPEMLDGLRQRNVPPAVLSNKPDDFTKLCVGKLLGSWQFAVVRGARDDTPRKPHPAGALAVADELDIPPGEWLYVGDTGTDMRTAAAAGMYPVGVTWGFRTERELRDNGAGTLISRPGDLLELL